MFCPLLELLVFRHLFDLRLQRLRDPQHPVRKRCQGHPERQSDYATHARAVRQPGSQEPGVCVISVDLMSLFQDWYGM